MRMLVALPLLLAAACNVEQDSTNDQTRITIDREAIGNAAEDIGNAAEDTAAEAQRAGRAVADEARRIDVDVDVRRNGDGNSHEK